MRGAGKLLNYPCPLCGGHIRLPASELGVARECPRCYRTLAAQVDAVVPDPVRRRELGLPEPAGPLAVTEHLEETRSCVASPGPTLGTNIRACARCRRWMDLRPEHANRPVPCPWCGHPIKITFDDAVPAPRPPDAAPGRVRPLLAAGAALALGTLGLGSPLVFVLGGAAGLLLLCGPLGLGISGPPRQRAHRLERPRHPALEWAYRVSLVATILTLLLCIGFGSRVLWSIAGSIVIPQ